MIVKKKVIEEASEMGKKFEGWECSLQCSGNLSPQAHYPMRRLEEEGRDSEGKKVVLSVMGMSCAACAGSIEKAIKRLPGIREAVVDVLNHKAQVLYYPQMLHVSIHFIPIQYSRQFSFCFCFSHFNCYSSLAFQLSRVHICYPFVARSIGFWLFSYCELFYNTRQIVLFCTKVYIMVADEKVIKGRR